MNLNSKTILITGIDNFIGSRTAELALAEGMTVRGLQSTPENLKKVQQLGVEVIIGDINNPALAEAACEEVDIVFHAAELAKEAGSIDYFREINVKSTVNMASSAKKAGVKTFVHLSSGLVYGFNYPDRVTESGPLCGEKNAYCETKIEAETALLKLNSPPDFGVIILRPGEVYGPGSIPWIVRPVILMRQKLFAYVNDGQGIMNHVYLDNLIHAMFLAIEKEAHGEIFNITDGQETTWKDYFTHLAEIANAPAPFSMSKDEIKLFVKLRCQGQKLFRKEPDILPESIDFMSRPYAYSITKAQTLLNYQPTIDLAEGMRRTQEWIDKTDLPKFMK